MNAEDRVVKGLGGVLFLGVFLMLGTGLAGGQAPAPGDVRTSDMFILGSRERLPAPWLIVAYHLAASPTPTGTPTATRTSTPMGVPGGKRLCLPMVLKAHPLPAPTRTPTPTATTTPSGPLIFTDDFNDGDMAGWTPHGGTWTNPGTFLQGTHQVYLGTAWNLRAESGTDFAYEGKVTLMSGSAAGLVFRSSANGESSYCLVLDATSNRLKQCINWPGWFGSTYPVTVEYGRAYTLRAELVGDLLRVYLDGVQAFMATLGGYYHSGQFGVLVHNGVARFDDLAAWRLP